VVRARRGRMVNFMVDELLAERVEVLERGSEASLARTKVGDLKVIML
jgi:hypothetical protein